jgi:enoyl-CoA hydratase/carnithine racemase
VLELLSAQEALALGLVDRVVPAPELMKETMTFALALAKRPPLAVNALLDGMRLGLEKGIEEGLRVDQEWGKKLFQSKDAKEGMTPFLEKREPVFKRE